MKSKNYLTAVLGLVVLVGLALFGFNQAGAQEGDVKPTVVPAEVLTPAPTPPDSREVAILTLVIVSSPDGKVEKVTLETAKIVRAYAPNVFDRPGEWTVRLEGEHEAQFGVTDPRRMSVFPGPNDEKTEAPHGAEFLTEVTWELVVPLYLFDRDLGVKTIHILDQEGNVIFATEVDREGWK